MSWNHKREALVLEVCDEFAKAHFKQSATKLNFHLSTDDVFSVAFSQPTVSEDVWLKALVVNYEQTPDNNNIKTFNIKFEYEHHSPIGWLISNIENTKALRQTIDKNTFAKASWEKMFKDHIDTYLTPMIAKLDQARSKGDIDSPTSYKDFEQFKIAWGKYMKRYAHDPDGTKPVTHLLIDTIASYRLDQFTFIADWIKDTHDVPDEVFMKRTFAALMKVMNERGRDTGDKMLAILVKIPGYLKYLMKHTDTIDDDFVPDSLKTMRKIFLKKD